MVVRVTTIPAIKTPTIIAGNDRENRIPNKNAATDPVQAPVIGKGTATNNTKAMNFPYFSILVEKRLRVRWNTQLKNFSKCLEFLISRWDTGSKNNKRKNAGIKFPTTDQIKDDHQGRSNPTIATGMAARNSAIGSIAINRVATSGGKF